MYKKTEIWSFKIAIDMVGWFGSTYIDFTWVDFFFRAPETRSEPTRYEPRSLQFSIWKD